MATQQYNKHEPESLKIETCMNQFNDDGSENYKIIDSTNLGIIPGSLADAFNFCYGDPLDDNARWRNPHEREIV